MSAQPVDIHIFGRALRVNCPADQQQALNQAAAELERRLQELKARSKVVSTEHLLFIVALNICYELEQEKQKTHDYTDGLEQRIRLLQQTIEQALVDQCHNPEKSPAHVQ